MQQQPVIEPQRTAILPVTLSTAVKTGLWVWLLLVVVPVGLKLLHLTRVAAWPWWKALLMLWVPWLVLVVLSAAGLLLRYFQRPHA